MHWKQLKAWGHAKPMQAQKIFIVISNRLMQSFTVAEIFQPVKSSVWILNWAGASFLYSRIARPAPPLPKFTDFNATHACQHDTHTLLGANPRPLLVPCCLKAKLFTMGWFQLITLLDFGVWKFASYRSLKVSARSSDLNCGFPGRPSFLMHRNSTGWESSLAVAKFQRKSTQISFGNFYALIFCHVRALLML